MMFKRIACLTFCAVLACGVVGGVAPSHAQEIKDADAAAIEKAESYLQDMKTAQARFVQTTHDGNQMVGTFYLSRPGKLRFEYDPPSEDFIVADGLFIYFYDAALKEQTNAPIKTTLANFFLRKEFSITEDLIVTEARHVGDDLHIKVVKAEEPNAGSITFVFDDKPFTLKKWRVTDQNGMITEVELFYLKKGVTHERGLFSFVDPNKSERGLEGRLND